MYESPTYLLKMDIEEIRAYCLSKKGVSECLPFNDTSLVFKVADKMFALLDLSEESRGISLKCDPEVAIELREQYAEVTPAYHFNKKHWNGVSLSGNIDQELLKKWIDQAYLITVSKLTKRIQEELSVL